MRIRHAVPDAGRGSRHKLCKSLHLARMLIEICVNFIAHQEVFHSPFQPRENGVQQPVQPCAGFLASNGLSIRSAGMAR